MTLGLDVQLKFLNESIGLITLLDDRFSFYSSVEFSNINGFDFFFKAVWILEIIKYYRTFLVEISLGLFIHLIVAWNFILNSSLAL